jgi:hypothetical protein
MPNDSVSGVAGVLLPDGTLVWVDGAPAELEIGMEVVFRSETGNQTGIVEIPPRLVVWRDPEVRCAPFVSASPQRPYIASGRPEPTIDSWVSPDAPDDGPHRDLMLELAWHEIERLDG